MFSFRETLYNFGKSRISSDVALALSVIISIMPLIPIPDNFKNYMVIFFVFFIFLYILSRLFSSGFGIDNDLKGKTWNSYHLSVSGTPEGHPHWISGTFEFNKKSNKDSIFGIHVDIDPPNNKYKFSGHLDGSRLLFVEYNYSHRKTDDCIAFFNNSQISGIYLGFWMGPNIKNLPTAGAYILSKEQLTNDRLNELSKVNPLLFLEKESL